MKNSRHIGLGVAATLIMLGAACSKAPSNSSSADSIAPGKMPRIGTVDDRFQSYNIEMVEVTGGRFWKPYKDIDALLKGQASAKASRSNQPAGMSPNLYQYRPPIDLSKARLRTLAAALDLLMSVSAGRGQTPTYFQNSDNPAPKTPPKGFDGVLTRRNGRALSILLARSMRSSSHPSPRVREPATPRVFGPQIRRGSFLRTPNRSEEALLQPSS